MKKLFILLSLSLSLFLAGCSSIYENHHRSTRLIIQFPKVSATNSRQIYDDNTLSDINKQSASFKGTICRSDGADEQSFTITPEMGTNTLVFSDLTPGNWTISCTAYIDGEQSIPDFAFAQKTVQLKAGDAKTETLSLSKNFKSSITNIEVKNENTSYELGDDLRTTGNTYTVILENGYSFEYVDTALSEELGIETAIRFMKHIEGDENTPDIDDSTNQFNADRDYFFICYQFKNGENTITRTINATINAKKPVISKQPENTFINNEPSAEGQGPIYSYNLSVEVASSGYYSSDNISYEWIDSPVFSASKWENTGADSSNYTVKGINVSNLIESSFTNYAHHCKITNTDNIGGLNGETTVSIDSNDAIVFPYNPESPSSAINNNYKITDVEEEYNGYFVKTDEDSLPSIENVYLRLKIENLQNGSVNYSYVNLYNGDSTFNVNIEKIEKISDVKYEAFGYVPYSITYSYTNYNPSQYTNTSTNSVYYTYTNSKIEKTETIYVKTQLPNITESTVTIANTQAEYLYRYYDKTADTYPWYYNKSDSMDEAEHGSWGSTGKTDPELHSAAMNQIYVSGKYYPKNEELQNNVRLYSCDFKQIKVYNNSVSKSKLDSEFTAYTKNAAGTFYNYYRLLAPAKLSNPDLDKLDSGENIQMYIECVTSLYIEDGKSYSEFDEWFVDKTPVTSNSPVIYFSKYTK